MHLCFHAYPPRSISVMTVTFFPQKGGSDDWAKGKAGIEYSYTVELPDEGEYGFLLPYWRIKSSVKEAFAGTKAMIKELIRRKRG